MRKSKLTADEIYKAEKAKDDRQRSRGNGFSLMKDRDASAAELRNYNGGSVTMQWHIPDERKQPGVAYRSIPDGMFALDTGKELLVFNAEEFRRQLRWV